ncbi:MAG: UbiA family prenyltransferase [Syntrophaceae bacterium]|nr:UbiA family prenyltransferase [Syntrophaceae bacterium]
MWQKFLIFLKVSRFPLWITLPLVFFLGLAYGKQGLTDPSFRFAPLMIMQILMLSFPICLFTFGLNDIYDYESDKINPRKKWLEGLLLSEQYQGLVKNAALLMGFVFIGVSLATKNIINIFYAVTILVISYVYSVPPWRLKTRPPLDAVSGGIIGFLAPFALGFSFVDDATALPFHAYCFTFCVMGFHSFSTIMDYDVDRKSGDRTFAVAYGKRFAAIFPAVACLFTIFFIHVIYIRAFFLFCFFLFIVVSVIPSEKIARYSFLAIYLISIIITGIWVGTMIIH